MVIGAISIGLVRYFIISGGGFLFFRTFQERLSKYRIQAKEAKEKQHLQDIKYSISTSAIQGTLTVLLIQSGFTKIYFHVSDYGWSYLLLSIIPILFIMDTYYYFSHRLLHWKPLMKRFHIVHHQSKTPTPLSTISFHPVEALILWCVFPLIVCTIPCHFTLLGIIFGITFIFNNVGHTGYEFYSPSFPRHPVFKWVTTSVFHNMHHTHVSYNFGLYSTYLDKMFGTIHSDYLKRYDDIRSSEAFSLRKCPQLN